MNFRLQFKSIQIRFYDLLKISPLASLIRSRSYSQFWEDRLILRLLNSNVGSYVDIGAGAPTWGSNTFLFYKKGWRWVCVDPIKFNMNLHKIIRRHDRQYRSVVSADTSAIEFYELSPWELSTTDESIAKLRIQKGAKLIRRELIQSISLETIYDENPVTRPAILNVDVEGAEMKVLQSNNWEKYCPDLICVEELTNPLNTTEIRQFLANKGYALAAYNGVTSIYSWTKSKQLINLNN